MNTAILTYNTGAKNTLNAFAKYLENKESTCEMEMFSKSLDAKRLYNANIESNRSTKAARSRRLEKGADYLPGEGA